MSYAYAFEYRLDNGSKPDALILDRKRVDRMHTPRDSDFKFRGGGPLGDGVADCFAHLPRLPAIEQYRRAERLAPTTLKDDQSHAPGRCDTLAICAALELYARHKVFLYDPAV